MPYTLDCIIGRKRSSVVSSNKAMLYSVLLSGLLFVINGCGDNQANATDPSIETSSITEDLHSEQTNLDRCNPNCFGSQIGQIIPPYVLSLSSNSTLNSEDLIYKKKPVFLFFFAKW